jgi:hypothetical protein
VRNHGSAMTRPVYLQQRTYVVTAGMAVDATFGLMHRSKVDRYSITLSARSTRPAGSSYPIALAV